jgi:Flp pilus assembly pilin Flp
MVTKPVSNARLVARFGDSDGLSPFISTRSLISNGGDIEVAIALLNSLHSPLRAGSAACRTTHNRGVHMFARFIRDDQGQDLIEYLLLGSFVSIGALAGAQILGTQLNLWYDAMGTWVSSAAAPLAGS